MIGERLRKLRKDKGMNQEELADIIGVQKSTVSLYEIGKSDPSDKIKIAIAKHFNISLDFLMGIIDKPVSHFNKDLFIRLPEGMSKEEKTMLYDYLDYLDYRMKKTRDAIQK